MRSMVEGAKVIALARICFKRKRLKQRYARRINMLEPAPTRKAAACQPALAAQSAQRPRTSMMAFAG